MSEPKVKRIKTFEPLPWQVEPWRDTADILLLTGSAGGGKSLVAAEKCHAFCKAYPGAMVIALRKVRAVMANSTVLMLKREIIGRDPSVVHRPSDFRFEYDNGSILAYGGMKDDEQRERIRSIGQKGGLDLAWMEEATEFEEEDFNELLTRMRGTAAPWRQIILTTNPGAPGHWINQRLILGGEAKVYYSSAEQNPYNADDYLATLDKLSGVQRKRLRDGLWVASDDLVYDVWRDTYEDRNVESGNVTREAEYQPDAGPVVWAVDDGYSGKYNEKTKMYTGRSHPRVFIIAQIRPDGTIAMFAEDYNIEELSEHAIARVLAKHRRNGWPYPSYVVRDRAAASLGGALARAGLRVRYNTVRVEESVKEMREWIAEDENGVRKMLVHPRCRHFRYEMASYASDSSGRPIKEHDNGPDAMRYLIWDHVYGEHQNVTDYATYSSVAEDDPDELWSSTSRVIDAAVYDDVDSAAL